MKLKINLLKKTHRKASDCIWFCWVFTKFPNLAMLVIKFREKMNGNYFDVLGNI